MNRIITFGGLQHTEPADKKLTASGPIPDVSFVSRAVVGEDQGNDGACVIFTFLGWSRIMFPVLGQVKIPRTNEGAILLYRETCKSLGQGDVGLTFQHGFNAAKWAGWLPSSTGIQSVSDLSRLVDQPILCGITVGPPIDNVGPHGCLDHTSPFNPIRGYHAIPVVARGRVDVDRDGIFRVMCLNHWTEQWGHRGFFMCSEQRFGDIASELWIVK